MTSAGLLSAVRSRLRLRRARAGLGRGPFRLRRALAVGLAALLVSFGLAGLWPGVALAEEIGGVKYMTLYDGDGNVLCETGFALGLGDEYVDESNVLWRVDQLMGDSAIGTYVRQLDLTSAVEDFRALWAAAPGAQAPGSEPQVGIYHTHSDESYVPSDGTESDESGHGGVYRVGDTLTRGLQSNGIKVVHSMANHLPHDGGAYERSRSTAMEVLRGSAAIFDVHRDAAPPEAYLRRVGGQEVTQIMMVLGRQNPQAEANLSFAAALKAATDRARPGLIRGILSTSGRFNQDLSPRALLLEVGAHTNLREDAEAAVADLAGVVPSVIGAGGGSGVGAWRAVGIITLLVVVGGGLWLYVATGGNWAAAWQKLRGLGEEFAGYLGRRRGRARR